MGSDRARVTYDPKQQYRSVVMQQGRVTLEADWNEAWQITNEELRKETLDFVGPCGTPDGGYKVVLIPDPTPAYDFYISSGTMYVGGMRAHLYDPVQYSNQPDWRDSGPEDPDWVDPSSFTASPSNPPLNEFVYLLLREQEVSAVEDFDLKDVALGGPDTAQRVRLLQRFVRLVSQGTDCVSGLAAGQAKWQTEGLYFDPDTMRLKSWGTLLVGFSDQSSDPDPCQPQARGGYLDPDNQLIRVQISGVDDVTGNPKFVWGFDDASFLYRISVDPNNPQNLVFQSLPVDSNHQPVTGQAVEVLRTAADLTNGGEVAATSGFVFTLGQPYDPDTQSIVMPTGVSLPLDYTSANQSPPNQLFLRVWQQEVVFTPGTPVALGDTGVLVTLATQAPSQSFHLGDYWMFAVRPATPQTVYPERYQNAPQPADGPRLWACPLGVISWSQQLGALASDCRNNLCTLVDLCKRQQGCCTITVRPQDLDANTTLQSIVNRASSPTMTVLAATPGAPGNNITVQISNLDLNASPPTFDLTVTEVDVYLGVTNVAGGDNYIVSVLGTDGLAHTAGTVNAQLFPLNNQFLSFAGGDANTKAQANVLDNANQQVVLTLEAKSAGADGNLTTATISNVANSPPTFDLTVAWQKTLTGLNMATLFPGIQAGLGYEILAQPPTTVAPAFPAAGITHLSGGAEPPNPSVPQDATTAQATIFGNPAKICLRAGSYLLPQPLVLGPEQSNITIEACGSATLTAGGDPEKLKAFLAGTIQLNGADNITLSGLTFAMPRIVLFQAGNLGGLNQSSLEAIGEAVLASLDTSVAVAVSGCQGLTVEDCTFQYPEIHLNEVLFAAGISAGADCADITLKRNLFAGPATLKAAATLGNTVPSYALAIGYIQADSLQALNLGGDGSAITGGTLIPSSLNNIVFAENSFENLAFPVVLATALGAARFESNITRSCFTGFTILPLIASVASINQAAANDPRVQVLSNALTQRMLSVAVTLPRPASFVPNRIIQVGATKAVPTTSPSTSASSAFSSEASRLASTRVFTSVTRVPLAKPPAVASVSTPTAAKPASATPAAPAAPKPAASQPAPAAPAAAPAAISAKILNLTPLSARVGQFVSNITDTVIANLSRNLQFSVEFSNNDVEALVAGGGSLWALTIVDVSALLGVKGSTETTLGSLTLTGNKFRNLWQARLVSSTVSAMVSFSAIAGNVIMNQATEDANSLTVFVPNSDGTNVAVTAVTGNVLWGTANLPLHTDPTTGGALPNWTTYNFYRI